MNLTKDQIEKLCEGFDVEARYLEWAGAAPVYGRDLHFSASEAFMHAFALGRQRQAKMDAELCASLAVKERIRERGITSRSYGMGDCANAIERSIEVK